MRFVNRTAELAALRRWWTKERPRPAVVWGRRRAGKTALLRQFASDLPAMFDTWAGRDRSDRRVRLDR